MSTSTLTHPAITDHTQPAASFLDWVQQQGYRVDLDTNGTWITATLIGTQAYVNYYGDALCVEFKGEGRTREQALAHLAENCSGRKHRPDARKRWGGLWTDYGVAQQMPSFTL